jgi:hypothetical protein
MKASKRTAKPLLAAQYQAEARRLAGGASNIERQFLSVSLAKGKDLEPAGRIAGARAWSFSASNRVASDGGFFCLYVVQDDQTPKSTASPPKKY